MKENQNQIQFDVNQENQISNNTENNDSLQEEFDEGPVFALVPVFVGETEMFSELEQQSQNKNNNNSNNYKDADVNYYQQDQSKINESVKDFVNENPVLVENNVKSMSTQKSSNITVDNMSQPNSQKNINDQQNEQQQSSNQDDQQQQNQDLNQNDSNNVTNMQQQQNNENYNQNVDIIQQKQQQENIIKNNYQNKNQFPADIDINNLQQQQSFHYEFKKQPIIEPLKNDENIKLQIISKQQNNSNQNSIRKKSLVKQFSRSQTLGSKQNIQSIRNNTNNLNLKQDSQQKIIFNNKNNQINEDDITQRQISKQDSSDYYDINNQIGKQRTQIQQQKIILEQDSEQDYSQNMVKSRELIERRKQLKKNSKNQIRGKPYEIFFRTNQFLEFLCYNLVFHLLLGPLIMIPLKLKFKNNNLAYNLGFYGRQKGAIFSLLMYILNMIQLGFILGSQRENFQLVGFQIRIIDYYIMLFFLLFFMSIDYGFEHPTFLRKFRYQLIDDNQEHQFLCGWIYQDDIVVQQELENSKARNEVESSTFFCEFIVPLKDELMNKICKEHINLCGEYYQGKSYKMIRQPYGLNILKEYITKFNLKNSGSKVNRFAFKMAFIKILLILCGIIYEYINLSDQNKNKIDVFQFFTMVAINLILQLIIVNSIYNYLQKFYYIIKYIYINQILMLIKILNQQNVTYQHKKSQKKSVSERKMERSVWE